MNANMSLPDVKLPEITWQMQQLGTKIENLGQTVDMLIKRLIPVLSPESPSDPTAQKSPALMSVSPLADNMRVFSTKIEQIESILHEALNRLEI